MTDINVVKERVIEELKKQGIDVYFIDFYVDDGGSRILFIPSTS